MDDGASVIPERELRQAIEGGQLVVYYQPKIGLREGDDWNIAACEALVRWKHPRRGMVFPDEFIPLAERTGLISPLTDCVLKAVIDQIRVWQDEDLSLSVAVNIAPQLLDDLELPDRIHDRVKEFDMPPPRLILEITEGGAMADTVRTMEILTRFRVKGFGLSIDDFGTGYSSLVQLHRMPFNEMKIDKSFVMEMDRDEEAGTIVRAIIDLGHNLGLGLCAEGVETLETMKRLRDAGCETAQGYYMSRPIPASEMPPFVRRWDHERGAETNQEESR